MFDYGTLSHLVATKYDLTFREWATYSTFTNTPKQLGNLATSDSNRYNLFVSWQSKIFPLYSCNSKGGGRQIGWDCDISWLAANRRNAGVNCSHFAYYCCLGSEICTLITLHVMCTSIFREQKCYPWIYLKRLTNRNLYVFTKLLKGIFTIWRRYAMNNILFIVYLQTKQCISGYVNYQFEYWEELL